MKKKVVIVMVALIALVAFAGWVGMQQMSGKGPNLDKDPNYARVERGDVLVKVVESGTIDAVKAVEVRSRASGRLAQLLVNEGDSVTSGQLIAVIDPQETQFRVQQDRAQLAGAQSGVARTAIEIEQSRITLRQQLITAQSRLAAIKNELQVQPTLTNSGISQAKAQFDTALRSLETLTKVSHPNQRTAMRKAISDAENTATLSKTEYERQLSLEKQGYVAGRVVESARLQQQLDQSRLASVREEASRLETQLSLELNRANNEVAALRAAYDRALASRIQDQNKRREYEQAVSAVETARANLKQIDVLRKTREQGQASVAQISSVLADSQRQLRETQVRAPFSGIVTKKYIEVGDLVTALSTFSAGTSVIRLEDRSVMRVKLEVNEIDTARLTAGMAVAITLDALPTQKLTGTIFSIAPASQSVVATQAAAATTDTVVKYQVEVYLDTVVPEIRSGMSAKCTINVVSRKNVLRLPVAYIGKDDSGSYVLIVKDPENPKDKPVRTAVRLGVNSGAYVELLSGVSEKDLIKKPDYKGPERTGFMSGGDEE